MSTVGSKRFKPNHPTHPYKLFGDTMIRSFNVNVGDRCWIESWGEDRPCVVVSLYSPTPVLLYDCQIRLEDCGQVVPYHRNRLNPMGPEPINGAS